MIPRRGRGRRPGRTIRPIKQQDPLPPPPQLLPPAIIEMACLCGQLLRISREAIKYKCACPSCQRRFFITLSEDKRSGEQIAAPVYVTEARSGDTFIAESSTLPATKVTTPPPSPPSTPSRGFEETQVTGAVRVDGAGSELVPEPPASMYAICHCGQKLLVKKEAYDKRVRCPYCSERMILALRYDPSAKTFDIKPTPVQGEPKGDTWTLDQA